MATRALPAVSPVVMHASDGRLVAAGLRTALNIAKKWKITAENVATLLGVSRATYYRLQRAASEEREAPPGRKAELRAQLADPALEERLSLILGIYGDLQSYFARDRTYAHEWVKLPNTNPVFGGHSPMDLMLTGRVVALWTVRQFVEAMLG